MNQEELFEEIPVLDDSAVLKISKDAMKVLITLYDRAMNFQIMKELSEELDQAGITHGILTVPEPEGEDWVIARGTPPVDGKDSRIEFVFDTREKESNEPAHRSDESCFSNALYSDPKLLNTVINVRKGGVLARKIPPVPGKPGMNVFGETIPERRGRWVAFKFGEGVEISRDNQLLLAVRDGKIDLSRETVSVVDRWSLDGHVDASTGHIVFWGKELTIKGSVESGFRVAAEGSIVIHGNIEDAASVTAGGNLTVIGLIRSSATTVEVQGDMQCKAIEYSRVKVGGDLEVRDYLLDASCSVRGHVWIVEGKGLVAGGSILAGRSMAANIVGTRANVRTFIHTGHDPMLRERYENTVGEIERLSRKLDSVKAGLNRIRALDSEGALDERKTSIRDRLEEAMHSMERRIRMLQEQACEMEGHLGQMHKSVVQIFKKAYPNTVVSIDNSSRTVVRELRKIRFEFQQGEITATHI